jgi:hypothetical protein
LRACHGLEAAARLRRGEDAALLGEHLDAKAVDEGDDLDRPRFRVQLRQLASPHAVAEQLRDDVEPGPVPLALPRGHLRVVRRPRPEIHPEAPVLRDLRLVTEMMLRDGDEAVEGRAVAGHGGFGALAKSHRVLAQHAGEDGVDGREVVGDGSARHAGGRGDLAHARDRQAPLDDAGTCGSEDQAAPVVAGQTAADTRRGCHLHSISHAYGEKTASHRKGDGHEHEHAAALAETEADRGHDRRIKVCERRDVAHLAELQRSPERSAGADIRQPHGSGGDGTDPRRPLLPGADGDWHEHRGRHEEADREQRCERRFLVVAPGSLFGPVGSVRVTCRNRTSSTKPSSHSAD